jgi:hypothetical protein
MSKAVPSELRGTLSNPDKVTLYTVVTRQDFGEGLSKQEFEELPWLHGPSEDFRAAKILASAELSADEYETVLDAFETAVNNGDSNAGMACFVPHHALRIEKAGKTVDILVCFKCRNYHVMPGGGFNNVMMDISTGIEDTWRAVVRKHGLRDVSDK